VLNTTGRPPVPYKRHCGVARNPTRPRTVPNQSMDLVPAVELVSNNAGDRVWLSDTLLEDSITASDGARAEHFPAHQVEVCSGQAAFCTHGHGCVAAIFLLNC
jgi:hypothetical protein